MLQHFLKQTSPKKQPYSPTAAPWLSFQKHHVSPSGTSCFLITDMEATRKARRESDSLSVDRDVCNVPVWAQTAAWGGWKCIWTIFRRSGLCNIQKAFSIRFKFLKLLWLKEHLSPTFLTYQEEPNPRAHFWEWRDGGWSTQKSFLGTSRLSLLVTDAKSSKLDSSWTAASSHTNEVVLLGRPRKARMLPHAEIILLC